MPRALRYAVTIAVVVTACSHPSDNVALGIPLHVRVLNSAETQYNYSDTITRVAALPGAEIENTGIPEKEVPREFTIAKASLKPGTIGDPDSEVLARIYADADYKPLHIHKGFNYVWRDKRAPDSTDRKFKTWIVPDVWYHSMRKLKRGAKEVPYSDLGSDHSIPHLVFIIKPFRPMAGNNVAFGLCIDDPVCGGNHCGYSALE